MGHRVTDHGPYGYRPWAIGLPAMGHRVTSQLSDGAIYVRGCFCDACRLRLHVSHNDKRECAGDRCECARDKCPCAGDKSMNTTIAKWMILQAGPGNTHYACK